MKLYSPYTLICLLPSVLGGSQYRLESGELITLGEHNVLQPELDPEPADQSFSTQNQVLFARQNCYAPRGYCGLSCCNPGMRCCWNLTCIDTSTHQCCIGGSQCLIGYECCGIGKCCEYGAQCCLDGRCCNAGTSCVVNIDTGKRGCLSDGRRTSTTVVPSFNTPPLESTTPPPPPPPPPIPTTTPPPVPTTATTADRPPRVDRYCLDPGFDLCSDQRFCCRAGSYCYYDTYGRSSCWNGNPYYTSHYYYSWSYSFGIRWYATTTSYYLGGANVVAMTTPPPPATPQPTSNTVPPPTDTQDLELSLTTPYQAVPPGSAAGTPKSTFTSRPLSANAPANGADGVPPAILKEVILVMLIVALVA